MPQPPPFSSRPAIRISGTNATGGRQTARPFRIPPHAFLNANGALHASLGQRLRSVGAPHSCRWDGPSALRNQLNRQPGPFAQTGVVPGRWPSCHRRPDLFARGELVVRSVDPAIGRAECVSRRTCGYHGNFAGNTERTLLPVGPTMRPRHHAGSAWCSVRPSGNH